MTAAKPTVVVTGASGNLGLRLLPLLSRFRVVGLDLRRPAAPTDGMDFDFEPIDLGLESSCDRLIAILRESNAVAVVHLAFVIDPQRTGVLDKRKMWQINVAGTARVLEAITEVNRLGGKVRTLVIPGSVSSYGPETPPEVAEDQPLKAHTLTYAVHKKESDEVVQARAGALGDCTTYLLRPHIFVGRTMENYLVGALRGTPTGNGRLGAWMRRKGYRLPMLLPMGGHYLQKRFQFVHVDNVARLIAYLLLRDGGAPGLHIFNVADRGEPITLARAAELANAKFIRLPGKAACRVLLNVLWDLGICAAPPDALPYMCGSYTMSTRRLREFLGSDYEQVIQHTMESGLRDSFLSSSSAATSTAAR
jgi:nucleoside-diphosphate-sugar epimerase